MNLSSAVGSLGSLSLINFGRKHAERLEQHEKRQVKARALTVRQKVDQLEQAYAARRPLLGLWSQATTAKDEADDALDEAVAALSYDLLAPALLNGDRDAPAYRVLFPEGNVSFIYGPDRAELAQVAGMVAYLNANPNHPMASRAALLQAKAATLEAALAPQAAAEAAYRSAQAVERDRRDALRRALRKSVYFLRDQFDGDEKQVEALFPSVAEAKVEEEVDPAGIA